MITTKETAGVSVVVTYQQGASQSILLIKRAKPPYEACWSLPGGRVEEGESLYEAAKREVQEETGLHVTPTGPWHELKLPYGPIAMRLSVFHAHLDGLSGSPIEAIAASDAAACEWLAWPIVSDVKPIKTTPNLWDVIKTVMQNVRHENV